MGRRSSSVFWGGLGYGGEVIRAVASFLGEVLAAASGHSELFIYHAALWLPDTQPKHSKIKALTVSKVVARYLLQVDRQMKGSFQTSEAAQSAALEIKKAFPILHSCRSTTTSPSLLR